MVQEILTYLILAATFIIMVVRMVRFFSQKEPSGCSSCFQAKGGSCKVAHLKRVANH
jgi:hypothetical protein